MTRINARSVKVFERPDGKARVEIYARNEGPVRVVLAIAISGIAAYLAFLMTIDVRMRRIVLTCAILGQMIQHVPDAALHASE